MFNPRGINRLLERHGRSFTLLLGTEGGTYDPITGTLTGGVTSSETFTGYMYNSATSISNDTNTVIATRACFISAGSITVIPTDKDNISDGTIISSISSVETISSSGGAICYMCHLE
jgi:hypothetical protein